MSLVLQVGGPMPREVAPGSVTLLVNGRAGIWMPAERCYLPAFFFLLQVCLKGQHWPD